MSDINPLLPRQKVPDLAVPLVGGGTFDLAAATGDPFTMVVFYRGLHCPICKAYLTSLEKLLPEFAERGVAVVAISSDTAERAEKAKADWPIPTLPLGHSLALPAARSWGLYISSGRGVTSAGIEEPPLFSEPGLFLVRPDGTLYFGTTQTMPFARPHFDDILKGIDFVVSKNYPARGEITALPAAAA
ncbi:peroxiredoxin-like family protein [Acuticoccus mangrovi]|uniref:AhpC/TSA family protein n=1 Tax=Acuticoccus mangrovi TaxID=2796142 RepID=A0A934MHL6_9HYPH|nr:peroxiredoxin-like family protein [Acuticoccus mangrovi]MBJ3776216.1 AhpC/TSA family protein [Acuticoccus mangrovi]